MDRYQGLVCDLDGVVYRGHVAVPHAVESLLARGDTVGLVLATNNASRPTAEVARQLSALGLDVTSDQVVTSAQAGAAHLASVLKPGDRVLAVGGPGVGEALTAVGLRPERTSAGVRAVLQGYGRDVRARDLAEAAYAIAAGATWIATNLDATLPTDRGMAPGNGTLVDAVEVATGRHPLVVGKPEAPLYSLSASRLGADPCDVLAVGDRLDTDILGAVNAGMDSLWVLTGVDDLPSFVTSSVTATPTYVGFDLRALLGPAPQVQMARGWWVCGDARVSINLTGGHELVRTAVTGSEERELLRDALLAAGFTALARLRATPGVDRGRLTDAAVDLTSQLA